VFCRNVIAQKAFRCNFHYIDIFDWEQLSPSAHCKAAIFPRGKIVHEHIAFLALNDMTILRRLSASFQMITFWHFRPHTY
jgi:hypothetical protein